MGQFITTRLALQKMLKVALLPTQKGKSTQNFMIINRKIRLQLHIRIGFKTFYYKIKVKEKKHKKVVKLAMTSNIKK